MNRRQREQLRREKRQRTLKRIKAARTKEAQAFDYDKALRIQKVVLQSLIDGATGIDQLVWYLKKSKYHKTDARELDRQSDAMSTVLKKVEQVGRQLVSFQRTIQRDEWEKSRG